MKINCKRTIAAIIKHGLTWQTDKDLQSYNEWCCYQSEVYIILFEISSDVSTKRHKAMFLNRKLNASLYKCNVLKLSLIHI